MAGDAKLTLSAATFLFFGGVATVDSITPYNLGSISAIAWWIVLIAAVYVIGRFMFALDEASRY